MKPTSQELSQRPARRGTTFVAAIVTAIGLSLAGSAHAALNLVNNGSFETGNFTGWTQFGNTVFDGVQCPGPGGTVAEGNCSAFFGAVGSSSGISQNLSLVVGDHYFLIFHFLPDGGIPSSFSASIGGTTLVSLTNPPASGYQSFGFNFIATAATEALAFSFRDDPGFLFLDAVSVQLPEPASVGLLGIALAAMFAGLRRRIR